MHGYYRHFLGINSFHLLVLKNPAPWQMSNGHHCALVWGNEQSRLHELLLQPETLLSSAPMPQCQLGCISTEQSGVGG